MLPKKLMKILGKDDPLKFVSMEEFLAELERPLPWWECLWWNLKRLPGDVLWFFKWRFQRRHQYNVVRLNLKPGYYDPCIRLLHAVMDETQRFVEFEEKQGYVDWNSDEWHQQAWKSYKEASEWWVANKDTMFEIVDWEEELRVWNEGVEKMVSVLRNLRGMWHA